MMQFIVSWRCSIDLLVSRMFKRVRKWFQRTPEEKWNLVEMIHLEQSIQITHKPSPLAVLLNQGDTDEEELGEIGDIIYHLFESNLGNRRVEIYSDLTRHLGDREDAQEYMEEFAKSKDIYQKKIYRWLTGRYDPEINTYAQVAEEDMVNKIKGSID